MPFRPDCNIKYTKVDNNSMESTRNMFLSYKAIDRFNNITNLNLFRNMVTYITEQANKLGYFPERLIKEEGGGKKAIFQIPAFKKLDGIKEQAKKIANRERVTQPELFDTLSSKIDNEVNYSLKSVEALQNSNVRQPSKNIQGFYNDLQKQGVSKEQIEIIKSLNPENKTKEELIIDLQSNYSFAVEINTASKPKYIPFQGDSEEERENTQYYSNLTVPGAEEGTYREIKFNTPQIIPSIKAHAQFADNNTIFWTREADKKFYKSREEVIDIMKKSGKLKIEC